MHSAPSEPSGSQLNPPFKDLPWQPPGPSSRDCTRCPLHSTCDSPGILPIQRFFPGISPTSSAYPTLLIVGESPGAEEDSRGTPFIGRSGAILNSVYLVGLDLAPRAHIMLTNAVRCHPPGNAKPTVPRNRCRYWLLQDLALIYSECLGSKRSLLVLLLGAIATSALLKRSLTNSLRIQGHCMDYPPVRVFSTYHPAFLLPGRSPSSIVSVKDHLALLAIALGEALDQNQRILPSKGRTEYRYPASGKRNRQAPASPTKECLPGDTPLYPEMQPFSSCPRDPAPRYHLVLGLSDLPGPDARPPLRTVSDRHGPPPPFSSPLISLDIETYGAVASEPDQNFYHPSKSLVLDSVKRSHLVQTASVSWVHPNPLKKGEFATYVFNHRRRSSRLALHHLLRTLLPGSTLIGMNIIFDLLYLRASSPAYRALLRPYSFHLLDLSVANYLQCEIRPEKSLKDLAVLFQTGSYDKYRDRMGTYTDSSDPLLHAYNAEDSITTLRTLFTLASRIESSFGPNTPKLTPYCLQWYSDLLWNVLQMSESGVQFNVGRLRNHLSRVKRKMSTLSRKFSHKYPGTLTGKGSGRLREAIYKRCFSRLTGLLACSFPPAENPAQNLQVTGARGIISTGEHNTQLLLSCLPPTDPYHPALKWIHAYSKEQKILTSYLRPLLFGKGPSPSQRPSVLIGGRAFPSWYIVPQEYGSKTHTSRDSSPNPSSPSLPGTLTSGGTKQGRIVPKRPALSTLPRRFLDSKHSWDQYVLTTRFCPGFLLYADLSQIELRTAALLSGDPLMMEDYRLGRDIHTENARRLFSVSDPTDEQRQGGKTNNFLRLFRGGAQAMHDTLLSDHGIDLPLDTCREIIRRGWEAHPTLWNWQEELIRCVREKGYLELPLIGQSRWFLGGHEAVDSMVSEIVNLPVQCLAANVLLSAQTQIWQSLRDLGLSDLTAHGLQMYDSLWIEGHQSVESEVTSIVRRSLKYPSFWLKLQDYLNRVVPLDFELKTVLRRSYVRRTEASHSRD